MASFIIILAAQILLGTPCCGARGDGDPLGTAQVLHARVCGQCGSPYLQDDAGADGLAFSRDGDRLLCHGLDSWLWDLRRGKLVWRVGGGEPTSYTYTTISPDGKLVAGVGPDGWSVVVGRASDGQIVHRLKGHRDYVRAIAWSVNSKRIVSVAWDRTLRIWNAATGMTEKEILAWDGESRKPLALSADASRFAVAEPGEDGVRVWDVFGAKMIGQVKDVGHAISSVGFSGDGSLLATVPQAGPGILWDLRTGARRAQLEGADGGFAFSPSGKLLAARLLDKNVGVWDLATGRLARKLVMVQYPDDDGIGGLAFSPDDKLLASGGPGNCVRFWQVATGKALPSLSHHNRSVRFVAYSTDGKLIGTEALDESVYVWDAATGEAILRIDKPIRSQVYPPALTFSADSSQLIARLDARHIEIWDLRANRALRTLTVDHPQPGALAISPDGKLLAFEEYAPSQPARASEAHLQLIDTASGRRLARLRIAVQSVAFPAAMRFLSSGRVAFSPDGTTLAWSTPDSAIHLWDVRRTQELRSLGSDRDPMDIAARPIESLAFSPDGLWLAAREVNPRDDGSDRGVVTPGLRVWDVARGKQLLVLCPAGEADPGSLAWSPDGATFACTYGGGPLRVWELVTGQELMQFYDGGRGPLCVAYAPDGRTLCTGIGNGTAPIWSLAPPGWTKIPGVKLLPIELEAHWHALGMEAGPQAYRAVWSFSEAPGEALPWLKEHLQPVPSGNDARVEQLLKKLDDDQFETREAAQRELVWLGSQTEPVLRQVLAGNPSEESRARIEAVLKAYDEWVVKDTKTLTALRAIWVLKRIGGPEARAILTHLAQGDSQARVTKEALAARALLERQGR